MDTKYLIFVVISALLVAGVYISSSTFYVFAKGTELGDISCYPQDGTTRCCADEYEEGGWPATGNTYCTTCDNTNPPSNCTPREKVRAVVDVGKDLLNTLTGLDIKPGTAEPKVPKEPAFKDGLSTSPGTQNEPKVPREPAFDNGLTTSPKEQNETEDSNEPAFDDGLSTSPGTR